MTEKLAGLVERITHQDMQSGFCVIKIKSKGFPDLVTVVGSLGVVNVGAVVMLKGEWKVNAKFGKQFQASFCQEQVPATTHGLQKYLGSGLIKGIGPANAKRIVSKFKEDTIRVMEEEPKRLLEVEGIGSKRVEMIKKAWREQQEIKNVMIFLQNNGVAPSFAVKIFKTYGEKSIQVVKDNPYRLAEDIWGIGFKTADRIAQHMGIALDSYQRLRAGLTYLLNQSTSDGHCYLTREELVDEGVKILEVEQEHLVNAVQTMVEQGDLISNGSQEVYLPVFYHSEQGVAKMIGRLVRTKSKFRDGLTGEEDGIALGKQHGIEYHPIQLQGIYKAVQAKFMVLTGGPGTGKTTTTLGIINTLEGLGGQVLLCAPTGRAAKRLAETTGREAKTVHRLLEFKPMEGFKRNQENPLACDVLIIDEASMLDIMLMYNLLKAVEQQTTVILVGDVDQLPSVGPGNVLRDIIKSQTVEVVKLEQIFRQAQGSLIITNAHRINNGEYPQTRGTKERDFFFMEEGNPDQISQIIQDLCQRRLVQYYQADPFKDIQVICPMQRGATGAANMNQILQQVLNPEEVHLLHGGTQYRLGDKVMQIRNNYDKNVYNGDIGIIATVEQEDKTLEVDYEGTRVSYEVSELDELTLAYAMTVHKSQGSEYRIVIAPFTTQHYMMLQRNLLYTCVTRAKAAFILIGTKQAIALAIKNHQVTKRNTNLALWLQEFSEE